MKSREISLYPSSPGDFCSTREISRDPGRSGNPDRKKKKRIRIRTALSAQKRTTKTVVTVAGFMSCLYFREFWINNPVMAASLLERLHISAVLNAIIIIIDSWSYHGLSRKGGTMIILWINTGGPKKARKKKCPQKKARRKNRELSVCEKNAKRKKS